MIIPRTNPFSKRQKVLVISDSPHFLSEAVIVTGTSVAGQNLMGQGSGIGCDDVTFAVTYETGKGLMGQRSGIDSDALTVVVTSDTRHNLMGSKDNRSDRNYQRPKEDETLKFLMKKAGFGSNVAIHGTFGSGLVASANRRVPPSFGSKVKPLSLEESIKLFASQSKKRWYSNSSQGKFLHVKKQRDERQTNEFGLLPIMRHNQIPDVLTPRKKVLNVLHHFRMVFEELDRNKAARCVKSQTDRDTQDILIRDGKQVNGEKRIGVVHGVEVGDNFKYKSQLSIIGLHFNMLGGIDYMNKEGLDLATSIVISQGAAYNDICNANMVVYCGEGHYLKRKNLKPAEDQKMTRGNLALANSMRAKNQVRLIIGRKKMNVKKYVYAGLYLVHEFWNEKGPLGNEVFKFKLLRLPGQTSIHLNY